MGPIEVLWGTIILVFVVVSLIRGYNRELGVTVLLLLVVFVELQFSDVIERVITEQVLPRLIEQPSSDLRNFLLMAVFHGLLLLVLFWSYAGRTLTFPGTPPSGAEGFFFNVLVGLVNGYLVAGTLWYYMDKYEYPYLVKWGLLQLPLTPRGQALVRYLPPAIFQDRPEGLAIFAAILFFLMVRK